MSNGKRLDIWTATQTVLKKNPGIRAKSLIEELGGMTSLSRSTIYEHLTSYHRRREIYREKGCYWLKKPRPSTDKPTSNWNRLTSRLEKAGGYLIDFIVEKFELSADRDPETGWYRKKYDKKVSIKGIMILRGAIELKAAAAVYIPTGCDAFLITQGSIDDLDHLRWKDKYYEVKKVEEIFDGYVLSYRIAELVILPW